MDIHGYLIALYVALIIVGSFFLGRSYELSRMNQKIRDAIKVMK